MNLPVSASVLCATLFSGAAIGQPIEEVLVVDGPRQLQELSVKNDLSTSDTAQLLRSVPGANVNSIGSLSGIAQYRGLSGERVAVQLDGATVFSGGPNAMDAPLSYAPPLLLKKLTINRGIASVNSTQESLGGLIQAQLERGDFGTRDELSQGAVISSRYQSVNHSNSLGLQTHLANKHHKVSLLASRDSGNDSEFSGGNLAGTQFERNRYDLSYGFRNQSIDALFYVGRNNTTDTGTPALPMDINFIDTDLAGFEITTSAGDWQINLHANYSDVDHGMDNFSQRRPPASPMMFRSIDVQADHLAFGVNGTTSLADGQLQLGYDNSRSSQNSDIFNPNNSAFLIRNFNHTERDIDGLFAQWNRATQRWSLETGIRYNRVNANTDTVAGIAVPPPVVALAQNFNSANRDLLFNYVDLVSKFSLSLNNETSVDLGIARKHRAPSYQELFLWAPLPITGGLADGRSYIGNLQLQEERSHEFTLGLNWRDSGAYLTPQLFYRKVTDYIQGTAASNPVANMVSMALSGAPALQFNNVDAQLYGLDTGYGLILGDHWRIDGNISYVQGERRDGVDDNLYRIAPLNHRIALGYQQGDISLNVESLVYAAQNDVSAVNNEQATPGYGLINLNGSYALNHKVTLSGGIHNAFNKGYRDHLAGYNRNGNSDVGIGERLFGAGRNLYLSVQLSL